MATSSAALADWYLHASQTVGQTWETSSFWYSEPVGGTQQAAFVPGDTYHTNGFVLRATAGDTFDGLP